MHSGPGRRAIPESRDLGEPVLDEYSGEKPQTAVATADGVQLGRLVTELERLVGAGDEREARVRLADSLGGLVPSLRDADFAAVAKFGLLIERLWPGEFPSELIRPLVRALAEIPDDSPRDTLVAILDLLVDLAIRRKDYRPLNLLLEELDHGPAPASYNGSGPRVVRRTSAQLVETGLEAVLRRGRWQALVEAALHSPADDPALTALLARWPERLLDHFGGILATVGGRGSLATMACVLERLGDRAAGVLETRLFDPRTQPATTAVLLLMAMRPARLLELLAGVLPSWDWRLQDLAVTELSRMAVPGRGRAFLEALPHADPLVVPTMLDEIGLERELTAVPLLTEIAAGRHERVKEVFARIKSVEALGRILSAEARAPRDNGKTLPATAMAAVSRASSLLRGILRERSGLAHAEPAGLRSAAEEALALIENRPSSTRVRKIRQAADRESQDRLRPRRYLRVSLLAPLSARVAPPEAGAGPSPFRPGRGRTLEPPAGGTGPLRPAPAKVTTLSLGGAFLEPATGARVGEKVHVEIRSGLRRIGGMAVVRNAAPDGTGVEFVHMGQADRERLRRLVNRLAREQG
jgi:hypothetical protein